jgi:predicted amidophosphoribosyltransferase
MTMALMICYECDGKVSSLAKACPHCGAPMENKLIKIVECGDIEALQDLIKRGAN